MLDEPTSAARDHADVRSVLECRPWRAVRESDDPATYETVFRDIDADPHQFLAVLRDDGVAIVGTMPLTTIPDLARACAVLAQLTCDKSRTDAHRFYERLGYAGTHEGFELPLSALDAVRRLRTSPRSTANSASAPTVSGPKTIKEPSGPSGTRPSPAADGAFGPKALSKRTLRRDR